MYIGAALLCQQYIALFSFFLAHMHHLNWIMKILQGSKAMILTMHLVMQRLEKLLERMGVGDRAPARVKVLGPIIQKALDRLRGSVGPHLSLATTGKSVKVAFDYFLNFIELLFLKLLCFFKSGGQSAADDSIWGKCWGGIKFRRR